MNKLSEREEQLLEEQLLKERLLVVSSYKPRTKNRIYNNEQPKSLLTKQRVHGKMFKSSQDADDL
jgi:hypothetical protein